MKYFNPPIESSYRQNDIGRTLYNLVLMRQPRIIVEFGALYGYSTICMAMALDELGEGKIISYDLWELYQYKHTSQEVAQANVNEYGLQKYVRFKRGDFYSWINDHEYFDMIHVDISNTGKTIDQFLGFDPIYSPDKFIVFEGGTEERDNVEWMKKYKMKPIRHSNMRSQFKVINPLFPGLSIL